MSKKNPEIPQSLTGEALSWWNKNINDLVKAFPQYTNMDLENWVKMANWHADIIISQQIIDKEGLIISFPNGAVGKNPALEVKDKAQKQFNVYLSEYGLTPNAKAKIERKLIKNEQDSLDSSDKSLLKLIGRND